MRIVYPEVGRTESAGGLSDNRNNRPQGFKPCGRQARLTIGTAKTRMGLGRTSLVIQKLQIWMHRERLYTTPKQLIGIIVIPMLQLIMKFLRVIIW